MAEKPIVFSTPMVQAILDGRKIQTRRIVKRKGYDEEIHSMPYAVRHIIDADGDLYKFHDNLPGHNHIRWGVGVHSKYAVGDILWVRETWDYIPDCVPEDKIQKWDIIYAADDEIRSVIMPNSFNPILYSPQRWRPSIHMPREAARLFLRVTGFRAERLQEITMPDVRAEGFEGRQWLNRGDSMCDEVTCKKYCAAGWSFSPHINGACFHGYWDDLNSKRNGGAYSWERNPWVWVIKFERINNYENMQ